MEALKQLLSLQEHAESPSNMLDSRIIPVAELENLHLCQTQGIIHLRQAAENIEAFKNFEAYSEALAKQEVAHG